MHTEYLGKIIIDVQKNKPLKIVKYELVPVEFEANDLKLNSIIDNANQDLENKYGKEYLKFPKLNELHMKLFNSSPRNLHNSLNDVLICFRCYYMIEHKVDIVEINEEIKGILIDLI